MRECATHFPGGPLALVVLLRGVNVGASKRLRPSTLTQELRGFDAINIGAAGTFVVKAAIPQERVRAEFLAKLPFDAEVIVCDGRDLMRAIGKHPFEGEHSRPGLVPFVSVLSTAQGTALPLPVSLPAGREWLLRLISRQGRFLFGVYKRNMKTISCLRQMEKLVPVPMTTRNWNTIGAIKTVLLDAGRSRG